MADPITVMTTISLGLKLVDQFRQLTLSFLGKKVEAPSTTVEQLGDKLQIRQKGEIVNEITALGMKLGEFDEVRYKALERRVKFNWDLYYELFGQLPELSADERARIKGRMERIKEELCEDFKRMVKIYEQVLGTSLPDHYSLYEVCESS